MQKGFFEPKIDQCWKKKGLFGPKKQAGAELKHKKKDFLSKRLNNFEKKKWLFGPKKQAGAELKMKTKNFRPKIDQFPKKKNATKKQAEAELKKKKVFFCAKNWGKLWK